MLGFLFGTLCLLGLVKLATHSAWHPHAFAHGHHGHHGHYGTCGPRHGGWHGHGGRGGGWGGPDDDAPRGGFGRFAGWNFERTAKRVLKAKLALRPDQEDVVVAALSELKDIGKDLADVAKGARGDVADAFRGDTVDEAKLKALWEVHEGSVKSARRDALAALKQIHAVLDPAQRNKLADLFAHHTFEEA